MRSLVIGFGSIGARHTRILVEQGYDTAVVSGREIDYPKRYSSVYQALKEFDPEYIVVANKTGEHYITVCLLAEAGFDGILLVEKPLFSDYAELPQNKFSAICVAYNLRFHPILIKLKEMLTDEEVLSIQAYVGQYLPDWRPDSNYRNCYSAQKNDGGGVLRDLSHELDFINWIVGPCVRVAAIGGHYSDLEITSDDLYVLIMQTELCSVLTLQMSYLDRMPRRSITINTQTKTIEANFGTGTVTVNGRHEVYQVDRDDTYRDMHRAVFDGQLTQLCSVDEALETVKLIQDIEKASMQGRWIIR